MTSSDLSGPPGTAGRTRPTLVVVSGRPGSGKSTLARDLAHTLGCPMVSRDEVNEGIVRTLGTAAEPVNKQRAAELAFDAFSRVLASLATSGVSCVTEAAFQDRRWRVVLRPLLPHAAVRIVHCTVDPELARDRIVRRSTARPDLPFNRPAVTGTSTVATGSAALRPFDPLSLPVPALTVSTNDGYDPKMSDIALFAISR